MADRLLVKFTVEGPEEPSTDARTTYPSRAKIVDLSIEVDRTTANELIAQTFGKLGMAGGFTPLVVPAE